MRPKNLRTYQAKPVRSLTPKQQQWLRKTSRHKRDMRTYFTVVKVNMNNTP